MVLRVSADAVGKQTSSMASNVLAKRPPQWSKSQATARQPLDLMQEPRLLTDFSAQLTQVELSERIKQLETDWQDLWFHFAANKRQKLALQDVNAELESEICRLRKDVIHETRQRHKAEAKLHLLIHEGDCNVGVLPSDSDED